MCFFQVAGGGLLGLLCCSLWLSAPTPETEGSIGCALKHRHGCRCLQMCSGRRLRAINLAASAEAREVGNTCMRAHQHAARVQHPLQEALLGLRNGIPPQESFLGQGVGRNQGHRCAHATCGCCRWPGGSTYHRGLRSEHLHQLQAGSHRRARNTRFQGQADCDPGH